jgi:threonine synthase
VGDFMILDCLRASGGGAVAVSERDIVETRSELGRLGLGYASLETAAAAAGLKAFVESGLIAPDDTVVLFDTGAGFKSDPPSFAAPATVPNDETYWKEKVIPGLG